MFPQTVRQRDYVFNCLGACGDGSLDVKEINQAPESGVFPGFLQGWYHQRSLAESSVFLYGNISTLGADRRKIE